MTGIKKQRRQQQQHTNKQTTTTTTTTTTTQNNNNNTHTKRGCGRWGEDRGVVIKDTIPNSAYASVHTITM